MTTRTTRPPDRVVLRLMYAGAALTGVATLVPVLARSVLADHVREGYPAYGAAEIDAAVTAYVVILSVVGVLGLLGWLATVRAVRAGKPWAPWLATALAAAAVCVAVAGLTVRDTSGDVGLAPLLAWLLVLPCVPGTAAVALLWRGAR
jgi:hypothetical protein